MPQRILIVEDEKQIRELLEEFLSSVGYEILSAKDGLEGFQLFKEHEVDLVILDIMMPTIDGYGLCQLIRNQNQEIPVIFLTALTEESHEVQAFDLKADDYLTKPFSFNVLIRRVEAVLRRSLKPSKEIDVEWLQFQDLKLNMHTFKCELGISEIELTLKEFNILKLLIESHPRVVTREALLSQVWGYEYEGDDRTMDTHIKNIRKKINYKYLKTVKGVGYVFDKYLE